MLDALVVSVDANLISTIQLACEKLGLSSKMCTGPKPVPALVARSKLYAVVLDALDPDAGTQVLTAVRQSPSSRNAVIIAVHRASSLGASGVSLLLPKPVTEELALRTLRLARSQMVNEFRRYVRHPLRGSVWVTNDAGQELQARGRDVSLRGVSIQLADSQSMLVGSRLDTRLVLPGAGVQIETKGHVAWCDPGGRVGICCTGKAHKDRQQLESWVTKQATGARV